MSGRPSDPKRDKHIQKLREAGVPLDAIAERTGLSKSAIQRRLAALMRKGGTISRSGISVR